MIIIVCWKNGKAFKIDIDKNKTILELKKEISKNLNHSQTEFNILNGNEIIDNKRNSETIESCKIGRLIRLPINYNPGKFYFYNS